MCFSFLNNSESDNGLQRLSPPLGFYLKNRISVLEMRRTSITENILMGFSPLFLSSLDRFLSPV